MKPEPNHALDTFRVLDRPGYATAPGESFGMFRIALPQIVLLAVSSGVERGFGWEHVSVSTTHRCPRWEEMCFVKNLFWGEEESVVQFHPKKSQYVDKHPYCLHLWKPAVEIQLPPMEFVG